MMVAISPALLRQLAGQKQPPALVAAISPSMTRKEF
jgi:hypothetical protein